MALEGKSQKPRPSFSKRSAALINGGMRTSVSGEREEGGDGGKTREALMRCVGGGKCSVGKCFLDLCRHDYITMQEERLKV